MTNSMVRIEVQEGAVKKILDELSEAQETIYRCYSDLLALGVVTVRETPPAATDGVSAH